MEIACGDLVSSLGFAPVIVGPLFIKRHGDLYKSAPLEFGGVLAVGVCVIGDDGCKESGQPEGEIANHKTACVIVSSLNLATRRSPRSDPTGAGLRRSAEGWMPGRECRQYIFASWGSN